MLIDGGEGVESRAEDCKLLVTLEELDNLDSTDRLASERSERGKSYKPAVSNAFLDL